MKISTKFSIVPTCLLSFFFNLNIINTAHAQSTQGCIDAVDFVTNNIKSKGGSIVFVDQRSKDRHRGYRGNPTNRTGQIFIGIGNGTRSQYNASLNILASPVLLRSWSDKIVAKCPNVAVVSFGLHQTDLVEQFAIQSNGKTRQRECLSQSEYLRYKPGTILSWNQALCL